MPLCSTAWSTRIFSCFRRHLEQDPCNAGNGESIKDKTRTWKLWQVEPTRTCNVSCIMCPWIDERAKAGKNGLMSQEIWDALVPHLAQVESIDFTGGGEPCLQEELFNWIRSAKDAGCWTGFLTNGQLLGPAYSKKCIEIGLDWVGFSMDGTNPSTFETIRRGADFATVCRNIRYLTANRSSSGPMVLINFVMMEANAHQLEEIVLLAEKLGADRVNFKNCDVIRQNHGKGYGLMSRDVSPQVKDSMLKLKQAERLAEKLGIATSSFSLLPDEQPVCRHNPQASLFIGYEGSVAPCINLAMGGPSTFLDEDVVIPTCCFGKLPKDDLEEIWLAESYRIFRDCFASRNQIYNRKLATADFGHDLIKLNEAFESAAAAMPDAPEGCRVCHYLYDI